MTLPVPAVEGFGLANLPFGVFSDGDGPRGGVRIGDHVLDLGAAADLVDGPGRAVLRLAGRPVLNYLAAAGPDARRTVRAAAQRLLTGDPRVADLLHPLDSVTLHLPFAVGDYTDFYAGRHHAEHVGALFRPDAPLLPNYDWVPIGYHGRASTVVVSGTDVRRPVGQLGPDDTGVPVVGPTQRLDLELELGVWTGASPTPGRPVPLARAADQVFGYGLLNDWSARDVQSWEYRPLGPFLAKNFATTVSPWVVTPEALAPFRAKSSGRPALPYLTDEDDAAHGGLDVALEVELVPAGGAPTVLSRSHASNLVWTPAQLVTHHTMGGCELRPGDLLGTGTISTAGPEGLGCLLELTRGGAEPVVLADGTTRTFLEDGDEVVLRGVASRPGVEAVAFGECRGRVAPPVG